MIVLVVVSVVWLNVIDTCAFLVSPSSIITLVVNYNTGVVLDTYMVDENALNIPDSQEYLDYVLLHCAFRSHDYVDQTILTETEKRTELSESDIAKINEGLYK